MGVEQKLYTHLYMCYTIENKGKVNNMKKVYKHEVGEEVNGLIIIEQTENKYGRKSYEVQSIEHETAPHIFVNESSLTAGQGCPYTSGKRIYEKTSIYSIERLRAYLVNVEESKTIGKNSKKKIEVRCPSCNIIEDVTVRRFVKGNVYCNECSSNTSYPELFFSAYLEVKGIEFEYQYQLDDSLRKFDFYIPSKNIAIETHGEQHYKEGSTWYESSNESDTEKRIYCKENNIALIELDCSKSEFKFIQNQIKDNKFLDDITKSEEKEMLKIMEKNKKYPIKKIIEMYTVDGMSAKSIGEKIGRSGHTVANILKKNGVEIIDPTDYRKKYDVDSIVKMYEDGLSMYKIEKEYNIDQKIVARILKRENVKIRKNGWENSEFINTNNEIIRLTKQGLTQTEISDAIGVDINKVYRALKKEGIKPNKKFKRDNWKC